MRSSKSLSWSGVHHILTLPKIPRIPGASSPLPGRDPHTLRFQDPGGAGRGGRPRRQGGPAPPLVPNRPGRPWGTRAGGVEGCLPADGEDIPTIWRLLSDHHHGFDVNPSAIEG